MKRQTKQFSQTKHEMQLTVAGHFEYTLLCLLDHFLVAVVESAAAAVAVVAVVVAVVAAAVVAAVLVAAFPALPPPAFGAGASAAPTAGPASPTPAAAAPGRCARACAAALPPAAGEAYGRAHLQWLGRPRPALGSELARSRPRSHRCDPRMLCLVDEKKRMNGRKRVKNKEKIRRNLECDKEGKESLMAIMGEPNCFKKRRKMRQKEDVMVKRD